MKNICRNCVHFGFSEVFQRTICREQGAMCMPIPTDFCSRFKSKNKHGRRISVAMRKELHKNNKDWLSKKQSMRWGYTDPGWGFTKFKQHYKETGVLDYTLTHAYFYWKQNLGLPELEKNVVWWEDKLKEKMAEYRLNPTEEARLFLGIHLWNIMDLKIILGLLKEKENGESLD